MGCFFLPEAPNRFLFSLSEMFVQHTTCFFLVRVVQHRHLYLVRSVQRRSRQKRSTSTSSCQNKVSNVDFFPPLCSVQRRPFFIVTRVPHRLLVSLSEISVCHTTFLGLSAAFNVDVFSREKCFKIEDVLLIRIVKHRRVANQKCLCNVDVFFPRHKCAFDMDSVRA